MRMQQFPRKHPAALSSARPAEPKNFFSWKTISLLTAAILLSLLYASLQWADLAFVYGWINILLNIAYILTAGAFFLLLYRHLAMSWGEKARRAGTAVLGIVLGLILLLSLASLYLAVYKGYRPVETSESPDGRYRIVVLESGHAQQQFEAYPLLLGMFYQTQDNGLLAYEEVLEQPQVTVEWPSNQRAQVRVAHDGCAPAENSNPEDTITVQFD